MCLRRGARGASGTHCAPISCLELEFVGQSHNFDPCMQEAVNFFEKQEDVAMAFLYGSRARDEAQAASGSDWDFALSFVDEFPTQLDLLARMERLKSELSAALGISGAAVDLVDLRRVPIGLCITVAEEGRILKGHGSLDLFRFYQRAWSAQEEFHFRKAHGL